MLVKIGYLLLNLILIGLIFLVVKNHLSSKKTMTRKIPNTKPIKSTEPKKGVQVDVMQEGTGPEAKSGSHVKVHYTAWLENGTKVDSSYDKDEIFKFQMGRNQVIPGWEAGMLGMKQGEKRKFTIAPSQAYGAKGKANVPPNATIIFEVELIELV